MPRYRFSFRFADAASTPGQCREFPNLAAALAEAQHAARALIRNRMRHLRSTPSGSLDIEDETHRPLARIMLAEVARQIS